MKNLFEFMAICTVIALPTVCIGGGRSSAAGVSGHATGSSVKPTSPADPSLHTRNDVLFDAPSALVAAPPAISLSATSLTFTKQFVSTTSTAQTVALINTGNTPMTVGNITIDGSAASSFSYTNNTCETVDVKGTCTISVVFTPSSSGNKSASLTIETYAPHIAASLATSSTIKLMGTGTGVNISFSSSVIPIGQSAQLTWSAPNATSCMASGSWNGSKATSGTQTVTQTVPGYYSYKLNCTGASGTIFGSAVLTASGPTPGGGSPTGRYGAYLFPKAPNQIIGLETSFTVPKNTPIPSLPGATLFLWPGLDPYGDSVNFKPIDNGVLQPVLTWGPSCAPTSKPLPYSSWWISAQYVNTIGHAPGYTGCFSGSSIRVNPGDVLLTRIALDARTGVWRQYVTDANTNQSVTFSIYLLGQGQNLAYWEIEYYYDAMLNMPLTFKNTTVTLQSPDSASWCTDGGRNNAYVMTPPTPQNANTQCFIKSIVLNQGS